jgi:hypothetical protein
VQDLQRSSQGVVPPRGVRQPKYDPTPWSLGRAAPFASGSDRRAGGAG